MVLLSSFQIPLRPLLFLHIVPISTSLALPFPAPNLPLDAKSSSALPGSPPVNPPVRKWHRCVAGQVPYELQNNATWADLHAQNFFSMLGCECPYKRLSRQRRERGRRRERSQKRNSRAPSQWAPQVTPASLPPPLFHLYSTSLLFFILNNVRFPPPD